MENKHTNKPLSESRNIETEHANKVEMDNKHTNKSENKEVESINKGTENVNKVEIENKNTNKSENEEDESKNRQENEVVMEYRNETKIKYEIET